MSSGQEQQGERPHEGGRGRGPVSGALVKSILILTILGGVGHRIALALMRDFDPDELQHLHSGYSVSKGLQPYFDYFDHHATWFAESTSWLISSLGTGWSTLMGARLISGALSLITLALVAGLARDACRAWSRTAGDSAGSEVGSAPSSPGSRVRDLGRERFAAAAASLTYATNLTQLDKAIEVRPDVPATLFFVLTIRTFLGALRVTDRSRVGPLRSPALAGFLLGCGFMLTPKLAFAAIGIGLGTLACAVRLRQESRRLIAALAVLTLSSLIPFALTALVLALRGQLDPFIRDVIVGPLGWAREIDPSVHLWILVERNPLHVLVGVLGVVGMIASGLQSRDRLARAPELWVLPGAAIMITIGWFIVPVPWPQFLLPLWPLLAVATAAALDPLRRPAHLAFAGAVALGTVGALTYGTDLTAQWTKSVVIPCAFIAGAATIAALGARSTGALRLALVAGAAGLAAFGAYAVQPHTLTYGGAWLLLGLLPLLVPLQHQLGAVALSAIAAVPLVPLGQLISDRPLDGFRAEFDWIMEETGPEDAVLTGWRGCAVFRPHAYRYYFLHPGMLQMLSPEDLGPNALEAIERTKPAAVIRDPATRGLGAEVQRYLDEHYVPTGVGDIWATRPGSR